jgi:2-dehydropantoate 2-reductase
MRPRLKIAVIGVGAMGSLFAGRLAPHADVRMFGHWPAQLAAIKASGMHVCHPDGRQTVHAVRVTDDVRRVGQVDAVIVLVKHRQTDRAARQAAQILAPDGVVVTLQNGLGNLSRIADVVGHHRATLGVTPQGAMLLAPGVVRDTGAVHMALPPEAPSAMALGLERLVGCLRQANFLVHVVPEADSLVWGKLAVNAGVNPLTALLGVHNGFVAEHAMARTVVWRAATEVAAVGRAQGIALPYADAGQYAVEAARATAMNQSSMWQDVRRGAPTEIEAMCGAIVRAGQAYGVPTPVNALLYRLVKLLEHGEPTIIGEWGTSLADADIITLINGLLTQACPDAMQA